MQTRPTACPQLLIFWSTCAVGLRVFTVPSDAHQTQMHDILYSCSACKEGIRLLASVYVLTDTTNLQGRFDIHGSVHRRWFRRNTNKMQLCNRIYYSKVYWRLNMFRAAHRSSSGALNCVCSLWCIYPCGDQPWQWLVTACVYKPQAANTV